MTQSLPVKPIDFFAYASSWAGLRLDLNKSSGDLGIPKIGKKSDGDAQAFEIVKTLLDKFGGNRILLGIDTGDVEDFSKTVPQLRKAKEEKPNNVFLSLYVEGPGGPTNDFIKDQDNNTIPDDARNWLPDEIVRIAKAAIDKGLPSAKRFSISGTEDKLVLMVEDPKTHKKTPFKGTKNNFLDEHLSLFKELLADWDKGIWSDFTLQQLRGLRDKGYPLNAFITAEIDNLLRVHNAGPEINDDDKRNQIIADKMMKFYEAYAVEFAKGDLPRLVIKNNRIHIFKPLAARIAANSTDKKVPRAMFADFHICEVDAKDDPLSATERAELQDLSTSVGIQTVFSEVTTAYRAFGSFDAKASKGYETYFSGQTGNLVVASSVQTPKKVPAGAAGAIAFKIEPDGPPTKGFTKWFATPSNEPPFLVGYTVNYSDKDGKHQGLTQTRVLKALPKLFYDREDASKTTGLWAHFMWPTVFAESTGGHHLLVNTYDRARFTFGFYQLAAHTPDDNLILLFRELLGLPSAPRYFPDLILKNNQVHRRDGQALVSLEHVTNVKRPNGKFEDQLVAFMTYLNPDTSLAGEEEALSSAKLMHWLVNDPAAVAASCSVATSILRRKVKAANAKFGLAKHPVECAIWVSDIVHQARGGGNEIRAALDQGTTQGQLDALFQIGSGNSDYTGRRNTVRDKIALLVKEKRFEGESLGKGGLAFS
jgi:hypothetical protein